VDELQRLRDRIEVLETLLGLDEGDVSLIQQVTGLGPVQAKILSVLRKRSGVVWSKQILFEVLYGDRPECDRPHGPNVIGETVAKVRAAMSAYLPHQALSEIWAVVGDANRYFAGQEPWKLGKTDPARRDTVLWVLAETIRRVTLLVQPFMPGSAAKILDQLAVPAAERSFAAFDQALASGTPLPAPQGVFPRFVEAAQEAKRGAAG